MSFTPIPNSSLLVDKPWTAAIATAMRDNPAAMVAGLTGADVLSSSWHPFDMLNVGDGATGQIYSFATNGLQPSVTVNFDAGYDYRIRLVNISVSTGANLQIAGTSVVTISSISAVHTGYIDIDAPNLADHPKTAFINIRAVAGSAGPFALKTGADVPPWVGFFNFTNLASALTSTTVSISSGNFDAGAIYLYRRRNFIG